MRLRSTAVFSLFLFACSASGVLAQNNVSTTATCADLHIVPAPRECTAVQVIPVGDKGISITAASNAEDQFAADDLKEALKAKDIKVNAGATGVHIVLARVSNADFKVAAMHDEGYNIASRKSDDLVVTAESATGIFYGVQTVKQLIRGRGKDAVLLVPTLNDWPAMAHRGLSEDWSRGPIPNMTFLKRQIRTLAAYKYNVFSPYFEHTFAYASTPVAAFPGGAMTPDEARELVAYAAQYHIIVIPEQESFGHLHHILKFEQYSQMGETAHGTVLAPGDATALPQIGTWFEELAKVFPAPYAHIGADETFELGAGRTRQDVKDRGLDAVYIDYLKKIYSTLQPNHKRLLFWGDIAVKSPELVATLPKDMVAVPWVYDNHPDYVKDIKPFTDAGLETWVAPGVNNWNRVYPDNNEALGNIRGFVRDGQKFGATGMLNTVWNDDGEGLFEQNWFGVLYGAAASWQAGESSDTDFTDSYGLAFHGDQTGKISKAQQELMLVHAAFKAAGLKTASDSYFWLDPYSPDGQQVMAKLMKSADGEAGATYAARIRLHAEKAITLLAEAKAVGKLENPEALDGMELGARRMDFIGYKFIAADECARMYKEAQLLASDKERSREVSGLLSMIGSVNGRIQDMRDGYSQLGYLYEQMWLVDNRPYWLANNMARYRRGTNLWIERGERWGNVVSTWRSTHTTLPSAADVGLPEPIHIN